MSQQDLSALQNRADLLESLVKSLESQIQQLTGDKSKNTTSSAEESKESNKTHSKKKPRAIDALGARMKVYEEQAYVTKILDSNQPLIVRLDGHCFHTFTKGFIRPFDKNLHRAMVLTTGDLVDRFQAYSGYTQSDEITLIFPAANDEENNDENDLKNNKTEKKSKKKNKNKNNKDRVLLFGGRNVKISSVLAGYCSTRFNYHLTQMSNDGLFSDEKVYAKHVQKRVINGEAHFDGRCFNVPNKIEVLNNVLWRCHFDCTRNSISSLARSYYSPKQMHGKGSKDLMEMLKTEKNIDWATDTPMAFRYGTFVKRELYDVEYVKRGDKQEKGITQRTRIAFTPIEMDKFDEKYIGMLLSKYWTQEWLDQYKSTMESVSNEKV